MTEFTSNKNKELLWNLLLNNGAFNNLLETQLPSIQSDFENLIVSLSKGKQKIKLMEKNKHFVQQMIQTINNYKQPKIREPGREMYTSQDIRNKKIDEFNEKIVQAQEDFNSVIKLKTPEEINFSDKKNDDEDKPIDNMDELIAKTIAERNLEVETIAKNDNQDEKQAHKWLNMQDETKKVSFNEDNNELIEASPPLPTKIVDNENNKLYHLLLEIKSNQIEILNLLKGGHPPLTPSAN
jgi:hypothetical protein